MRWLSQMKEYVDDKVIRSCVWVQTLRNEKGQGMLEYAVIAVLILLLVIVLFQVIGIKLNNGMTEVNTAIPAN